MNVSIVIPEESKSINELINNNEPFAVVQYFTYMRGIHNVASKDYEILTLQKFINRRTKKDVFAIKSFDFSEQNMIDFKNNSNKLKKVVDDESGIVWEFLNFKEFTQKFDAILYEKIKDKFLLAK